MSCGLAREGHASVATPVTNLPYFDARMNVSRRDEAIEYRSAPKTSDGRADFQATYRPVGPAFLASPGSLEHFLVERYRLYHVDRHGRPYALEIHHPPWLLRAAAADIIENSVANAAGLRLPETPPLLHFAQRQDTVAWRPTRPGVPTS